MPIETHTLLGWIGMLIILAAFALRRSLPSRQYALMNLAGAVLIGITCFVDKTWPVFALQVAWGCIAVIDLVRSAASEGDASPSDTPRVHAAQPQPQPQAVPLVPPRSR